MGCCPDIAGGRLEGWDWGNHIHHPTPGSKKGTLARCDTGTAIKGAGPD